MDIHCYLDSSSSSSYGPRSDKDWGTFTLTIPENGHPIWTNVNGTWKGGIPWVNVNGTWQSGITWVNDGGTWKVLS
ncbi:MAG: hypothetical protein IJH65_03185 [Methanobrevibacter sp.]|nr:hypothetical protein [Methanobrevibacter sp.]